MWAVVLMTECSGRFHSVLQAFVEQLFHLTVLTILSALLYTSYM